MANNPRSNDSVFDHLNFGFDLNFDLWHLSLPSSIHITGWISGQIHHPLADAEESIETPDDPLPSEISKNPWL
jgi:hypothetical protein